ncbi:hypothetical protein CDD81_5634 [Ophiocordyceps australis]|uniref:Carrier domain-containing protein n=1 Tax=Ophiocordyceps australis TaxID=1399860 RepID=A0A2C5Y7P3_9HYPO|nr:hypothetical protein CDD81_5634 [Ophiocordyceps australis]
MRVLEIGAGTGSFTSNMLPALVDKRGTRMYSKYIFTDISSAFFPAAGKKFNKYSGLEFQTLDITVDPAQQGFELGSYDVILASNVLHATPCLQQTLRNVRRLLRSGGVLFLDEVTDDALWNSFRFIVGFLPGWWLGGDDGRISSPLVSTQRWCAELSEAGFCKPTVMLDDDNVDLHCTAQIIVTASDEERNDFTPDSEVERITLLYHEEKHPFACKLADALVQAGFSVEWSRLGHDEAITDHDVIATMDLEKPFLHDITASEYEGLMKQISQLQSGMIWLTRPAQVHCQDPRYGLVMGLARTVRLELLVDFTTIELQDLDPASVASVVAILAKVQRQRNEGKDHGEAEFAIHDGVVLTGRYHWSQCKEELEDNGLSQDSPLQLTCGSPPSVDSLYWLQHEEQTLGGDEVEVEMRCASLNFKDVAISMGLLSIENNSMGADGAGIVRRVGHKVDHVRPGDRVMILGQGTFTNRLTFPGRQVQAIPPQLSFEDAAAMASVFMTVIYAVINVGQLAKGQSILIHSACGGVGMAALQLCRMIQADIYVTVGNEDKVNHLVDAHQVPRDRIFNSRNTSFVKDIMRATGGRGVDLVLNSLSGELLYASWSCVAPGGKMLELGKRDLRARGHLSLELFEDNRSFHGIFMPGLYVQRPSLYMTMLQQLMGYYKDGHIGPIRPVEIFPASRIADAMHYMQQGRHMGKIVISIPTDLSTTVPIVKTQNRITLSDTGCYLVVGGISGLGKSITTWMVERGARNFVFLSPSAGKRDEDQLFLRELESQACRAVAVAGSAAEMSHVQQAIKMAPAPIVGVLQLAMVLRDALISNMTFDDWNAVLQPKVKGTWNLHEAFAEAQLDFFLLFSSVCGVCGNPGQANYAAAGSFLDSFVQYRRAHGLPCSIIDLGIMRDVGYINKYKHKLGLEKGFRAIYEGDLVTAVELAICSSPVNQSKALDFGYCSTAQLAIGLDWVSFSKSQSFRRLDARMSLTEEPRTSDFDSDAHGNERVLKDLLASAASRPECLEEASNFEILTTEIGRAICKLMMWSFEDFDMTQNLSTKIDSLVSIEIRTWWRRNLGIEVSVLQLMSQGTVEAMARLAIKLLRVRLGKVDDSNVF